jgi:CheY-like chemotaxis protein
MPGLDGLDLLKEIRTDDRLRAVPVVLLTARAGEDAAIGGLLAGADDYVVKPFSGRELVARLGAQVELARVRKEGEDRFRALINASWDVVYRMNADWSEMRALDGRGFIADTQDPSTSWLERYIPVEDRPQVSEAIARAVENRTVFELEHRVHRPDGTLGWTLSRAVPLCDDEGRIVEWVGAASDVTARREGS